MKKLILSFLFIACLYSVPLFSQGFYVKINAGYGMPSPIHNTDDYSNYSYIYTGEDFEQHITERVNFSLGKGVNLGGNAGFMFNSNVGVDLGLSYLRGGTTETRSSNNSQALSHTYIADLRMATSATMLRVSPSVILVADLVKINPYARFGAVIGNGKITHDVSSYVFNNWEGDFEEIKEWTYESTGGTAFGLTAGIGALHIISDRISVYGELSMISMNYAPEKQMTVKYLRNGEDELNELSLSQRKTLYLDKVIKPTEVPHDEPWLRLKQTLPFGSFGFNFGIRIGL
jgi:opacity protein-like surface antigen